MSVNPNDLTLVVHFDPVAAGDGNGHRGSLTERLHEAASYCRWAGEHARSVALLLPDHLETQYEPIFANLTRVSVVWHSAEVELTLPKMSLREPVWLVNGNRLPFVDWEAARSAARRSSFDVLLFDPPAPFSTAYYPESVEVDETGRVLSFRRHYSDSPTSADRWSGEACLLAVAGRHARAVVGHVAARGWGLESIGSLTRYLHVRWSSKPCLCETDYRLTPVEAGKYSFPAVGAEGVSAYGFTWNNPNDALYGPMSGDHHPRFMQNRLAFAFGATATTQAERLSRNDRGGNGRVFAAIADRLPSVERWFSGGERAVSPSTNPSFDGRKDRVYLFFKRLMDISIAGAGLTVLSPFLLAVAILVKGTSRGPILFSHRRQGLNGKEFRCLKFRSMACGAEAMKEQLRALNEVDGPQFKISADPRLTKLGSWLRRYNVDEIPQLLNVLFGQMSLVGPRPSPDDENQLCPAWRRARLSLKPGMTGLWQVLRRRNDPDTDFQEWIYYDVEYAKHRSLWLDWQLLVHTPWAIFAPRRLSGFIAKLEQLGMCGHAGRIGEQPAVHMPQ